MLFSLGDIFSMKILELIFQVNFRTVFPTDPDELESSTIRAFDLEAHQYLNYSRKRNFC